MLEIRNLIARQQNYLLKSSQGGSIASQIYDDYGRLFLKKLLGLEKKELCVQNIADFLVQNFSLTARTPVCVCARPSSVETNILIEMAECCAINTDLSPASFLLPGVFLLPDEMVLSLESLLSSRIVSLDKKSLIPTFICDYNELHAQDAERVQRYSIEHGLYQEMILLEKNPAFVCGHMISKINLVEMALQDPQDSCEILFDFFLYCQYVLSFDMNAKNFKFPHLKNSVPTDFSAGLYEILKYIKILIENDEGVFIVDDTKLRQFFHTFGKHHFALERIQHHFAAYAQSAFFYAQKQNLKNKILTSNFHKRQTGIISKEFLAAINAQLELKKISEVIFLENILAQDFNAILRLPESAVDFCYINPTKVPALLAGNQSNIFYLRLSPEQRCALFTSIQADKWAQYVDLSHVVNFLLLLLEDRDLLVTGVSHIGNALPKLVQNYIAKKSATQETATASATDEDKGLDQLFSWLAKKFLDDVIEKQLMSQIDVVCKYSFFKAFIRREKPAKKFNKDYWLKKFDSRPLSIKEFLPQLSGELQKDLLVSLISRTDTQKTIPDIETLFCYAELLKKYRLDASLRKLVTKISSSKYSIIFKFLSKEHDRIPSLIAALLTHLFELQKSSVALFFKTLIENNDFVAQIIGPDLFLDFHEYIGKIDDSLLGQIFKEFPRIIDVCLNKQIISSPAVCHLWLEHVQQHKKLKQDILELPSHCFTFFYSNLYEQARLLNLLYQYGLNAQIGDLYERLKENNFSCFNSLFIAQGSYSLITLEAWLSFISLYETEPQMNYFIAAVVIPMLRLYPDIFNALSADSLKALFSHLGHEHQVEIIGIILNSECYNKYSADLLQFVLGFGANHLIDSESFKKRLLESPDSLRQLMYQEMTSFDHDRDSALIFSIDDLVCYQKAFSIKAHDSLAYNYFIHACFRHPTSVKNLCKSAQDWQTWLSFVPEDSQASALQIMFHHYFDAIKEQLHSSLFRNIFKKLEVIQLLDLIRNAQRSSAAHTRLQGLVMLGLTPSLLEQLIAETDLVVDRLKFKGFAERIFEISHRLSYSLQNDWIFWALEYDFDATLTLLKQAAVSDFYFKTLSGKDFIPKARRLFTIHTEQAEVVLWALHALGMPNFVLGQIMVELSISEYTSLWGKLQKLLSPGDFCVLFEDIHRDMQAHHLQELAYCCYMPLSNNKELYSSIFIKLFHMCTLRYDSENFPKFFNSFAAVQIMLGSDCSEISEFIITGLLYNECEWLKSIHVTAEQIEQIKPYLTSEEMMIINKHLGFIPSPPSLFKLQDIAKFVGFYSNHKPLEPSNDHHEDYQACKKYKYGDGS